MVNKTEENNLKKPQNTAKNNKLFWFYLVYWFLIACLMSTIVVFFLTGCISVRKHLAETFYDKQVYDIPIEQPVVDVPKPINLQPLIYASIVPIFVGCLAGWMTKSPTPVIYGAGGCATLVFIAKFFNSDYAVPVIAGTFILCAVIHVAIKARQKKLRNTVKMA